MMITLSWNFFLGVSLINQEESADTKQEWLKLRVIDRSDCAIFRGGRAREATLKGQTHFMDTACSQQTTESRLLRSIQLAERTTSDINGNKTMHESRYVAKQLPLCLFWGPTVSGVSVYVCRGGHLNVNLWGNGFFSAGLPNSNMCHFVKRTNEEAPDRSSPPPPTHSVHLQQWLPSVTCYF